MKTKFIAFLAVFMLLTAFSCKPQEIPDPGGGKGENPVMLAVPLPDVYEAEDAERFAAEVDLPDGRHNNAALDEGIIISPHFSLEIDGREVAVYAVRTANGLHSFAKVRSNADNFPMEVRLTRSAAFGAVECIPSSMQTYVKRESDTQASAKITEYGAHTFIFGKSKELPLTVFVSETEVFSAPEGYAVKELEAGAHSREDTSFTGEKQVLYFKAGLHYVHSVNFLSNTAVYLEDGALLRAVMPGIEDEQPVLNPAWSGQIRWSAFFNAIGKTNVRIYGGGVADFTRLDWHARLPVYFEHCKNVRISGIMLNNAPEWNIHMMYSEDIEIDGVKIFGYRQNSDGIAIVDSRNAEVRNCFARSGDDLFEVKSMDIGGKLPIENILFEGNFAWPDKCRGFGIIYESMRDIRSVTFRNCAVGFADAKWMDALGAIVVIAHDGGTIEDILFENIEIYESGFYPINCTLYAVETAGKIQNITFRNIRYNSRKPIRVCNNSGAGGSIEGLEFYGISRNGRKLGTKLHFSLKNVSKSEITISRGDGNG